METRVRRITERATTNYEQQTSLQVRPLRSPSAEMRDDSLKFLEELINTPSPTGYELRGQRVWLDYVTPFADETETDAYGNAVAWFNKGGSPRIMLAAHADEIAMAVNYIDDKGYISVRRMGGVDPAITK